MTTRVSNDFIATIQGRDFVLMAGLLDLAHQDQLKRVTTQVIQIPIEENHFLAIVHASVETKNGTFEATGDASPKNVKEQLKPHIVRMAETRAVCRALRWATNVAMTAFEELGGDDPGVGDSLKPVQRSVSGSGGNGNGKATQTQIRTIYGLGKKQGWSEEEIEGFVQQMFNISHLEKLDKAQASTVIQELQAIKEGDHAHF